MMKRPVYINGASALSIQDSLSGFQFDALERFSQSFVPAKDPDFKKYIPPMIARRMSRMIKRAITVSQIALQQAEIEIPDAIIFGTGLGCIEDTEKFLNAVLDQEERFLQPSFFIQSTHNTIASQVAMRLGCHGYNNTLVQRGLSFESALLDAILLFEEGRAHSILTGGHDELTSTYFSLLDKAGYYSYNEVTGIGNFAGEGSVSFVLSDEPKEKSYAQIEHFEMCYTPSKDASFGSVVLPFLEKYGVVPEDIKAVFTAYTEDEMGRSVYRDLSATPFAECLHIPYKMYCGEFFSASAFGLWMAANFLSEQASRSSERGYALLHNHSFNKHHAVVLLKKVGSI